MIVLPSSSWREELAALVARRMGLEFPPERASDLDRGLRSVAAELGFGEVEECHRWLLATDWEKAQLVLARHLTIGETYFFRDRRTFASIEEHVLPELIARREGERRLSIWSAACCTGEEAYSLAISARRAWASAAHGQVRVVGTDINRNFLERADKGVFGEWSFRETPADFRERYFTKVAEAAWQLRPEIRQMVEFSPLNLAADTFPSLRGPAAVDLIFCRNVLIYFGAERAAQVVAKLTDCLSEGGWLVLGPSEVSHGRACGLEPVTIAGSILFRKTTPKRVRPPSSRPDAAVSPEWVSTGPLAAEEMPLTLHPVARMPAEPAEPAAPESSEGDVGPSEKLAADEAIRHVRALADQGRATEARIAGERLVAANKLDPLGHYLCAGILQELGDFEPAAAALRRALYLDPEFALAHFALGNVVRSQSRMGEARRHFANALALVRDRNPEDVLPESDGLTAGRLAEIIANLDFTRSPRDPASPAGLRP